MHIFPTISYNIDAGYLTVFGLTVLFLVRDRYVMVKRHDRVIENLSEKLTDVSNALIKLAAEFHTYREMSEKR